jgi:predicted sulfurtransferase
VGLCGWGWRGSKYAGVVFGSSAGIKFEGGVIKVGKCVDWEGGWWVGYLFRFCKRKHTFIKTNMTGDIYTLRCEIETTITKMRGTIT